MDCSLVLSALEVQTCAPEDVELCSQQIALADHEAVDYKLQR